MAKQKKRSGTFQAPGGRLSHKELDHLDQLLGSRGTGCPGIEQLDGFLAAILAGPEMIPPSQAMGYILGEVNDLSRPSLGSMAETERLISLILRHWNSVAGTLLRGDYAPTLTTLGGRSWGNDWAQGFINGTTLWAEAWRGLLADPTWYADLTPIMALAGERGRKRGHPPITDATRESYLDSLGPIAIDVRHHFIAEPAPSHQPTLDLATEGPDISPPHWEVGWIPFPGQIEDEPDARLVAALIVTGAGRIVAMTPEVGPPAGPEAMAKILAREVGTAIAKEGPPPEIWVMDQTSVTALRRLPILRHVILDIRESLPVFEAVRTDFVRQFSGGDGEAPVASAPTWTGWGLDPELVAGLFEASAALFRAAPWRLYPSSDPLMVRWPTGLEWLVSVMGAADVERGLMCFAAPEDLNAIVGAAGPPTLRGVAIGLAFAPLDDLTPAMRQDIKTHQWKVAAPDAYPSAYVINSPTAGISEPMATQLRDVIHAVSRFGSTKTKRRGRAWLDQETGIVIER